MLIAEDEQLATSPVAPAGASALRAESLSESVTFLLVLMIVQRVIGFVRSVLFCRWLSAEQLGQWDMVCGFLMLAAPLAVLGLPGSFGRYVEHYRQRGQLRQFLRRSILTTLGLGLAGVVSVALMPGQFAELIFGEAAPAGMMAIVVAGLAESIVHNLLTSLFIALRRNRLVSMMQFLSSLVFAGAGTALLWYWPDTLHVVLAFAIGYGVTICVALGWARKIWRELPQCVEPLPHRTMWSRLMPFAISLWLTNWLLNMFEIADRFLLVHMGGFGAEQALDMVGQYHSARLVPVLLVNLAELMSAIVTPHLSSDWEAGRRERVSRRLGLVLKLFGLATTVGSAVFLIAAPLLFRVAFNAKYAAGEAILPWTLLYCVWTSLASIGFNYLWCAERSRLVTGTLVVGLALNVALNLALLPVLGLWGAVLSTTIAKGVVLFAIALLSKSHGMRIDRGLLMVAGLPLLLAISPWATLAAAAIALGRVPGLSLWSARELAQLRNRWRALALVSRLRLGTHR